jgi:hypothetical protein
MFVSSDLAASFASFCSLQSTDGAARRRDGVGTASTAAVRGAVAGAGTGGCRDVSAVGVVAPSTRVTDAAPNERPAAPAAATPHSSKGKARAASEATARLAGLLACEAAPPRATPEELSRRDGAATASGFAYDAGTDTVTVSLSCCCVSAPQSATGVNAPGAAVL